MTIANQQQADHWNGEEATPARHRWHAFPMTGRPVDRVDDER